MLSQRWMFKNAKYKNLSESLYNKKKVAVWISESAFVVFKLRHLTYKEYCLEFMLRLFIEKVFESKGRKRKKERKKERKKKEKNRKHKNHDICRKY